MGSRLGRRVANFANLPIKFLMPSSFSNITKISLKTIPSASKIEIKRVLESLYGFEVEKVQTLNMDGKKKKRGGYKGDGFGKSLVADIVSMQPLKDIVPAASNNINTKFIVLEKGRIALEGQQNTCLALVADETAAVHFQMWGDECDAFEAGDIIRLENGIFSYIRNNRNNHVLRAGKRGKAEKVGEFTMAFVEKPNMSEIHWVPDPKNPKIYIPASTSEFSSLFPPTR